MWQGAAHELTASVTPAARRCQQPCLILNPDRQRYCWERFGVENGRAGKACLNITSAASQALSIIRMSHAPKPSTHETKKLYALLIGGSYHFSSKSSSEQNADVTCASDLTLSLSHAMSTPMCPGFRTHTHTHTRTHIPMVGSTASLFRIMCGG